MPNSMIEHSLNNFKKASANGREWLFEIKGPGGAMMLGEIINNSLDVPLLPPCEKN